MTGSALLTNEGDPVDKQRYQTLIGSITNAVTATRPDIAQALGFVNQFSSNPSGEHWQSVKRILRYIKGTLDWGIQFADLNFTQEEPTVVQEDIQGAIAMSKNPKFHARTKHIDIKHNFIREKVENGELILKYCPTNDMIADLLTKALPRTLFEKCSNDDEHDKQSLSRDS